MAYAMPVGNMYTGGVNGAEEDSWYLLNTSTRNPREEKNIGKWEGLRKQYTINSVILGSLW